METVTTSLLCRRRGKQTNNSREAPSAALIKDKHDKQGENEESLDLYVRLKKHNQGVILNAMRHQRTRVGEYFVDNGAGVIMGSVIVGGGIGEGLRRRTIREA